MPMLPGELPDPILVTRPAALQRMLQALTCQPIVAVDTESNSLYAYREQVCLVQFSTPDQDYLVDPLALRDLSPLERLFGDALIEKVFHAAEYDLICLKRDFGFEFRNLFDTMVAARILGRQGVGLGALLQSEFDLDLDKRHQRANWGQRPLPPALLAYARLDTHYLIRLRSRLLVELQDRLLWPLAEEDFNRLGAVNGTAAEEKTPVVWRISGASDLEPQQAAVLLELCRYRDGVARTINRPLFKVINDPTLIAIARASPKDSLELSHLPGMSYIQMKRHGQHILEAVRRGMAAEPLYPLRSPRPNEQYLERQELLRRWRKSAALKMGVPSDVVLPRDVLHTLAERNPRSHEELAALMQDTPWRLEHFGEEILNVLKRRGVGAKT